MIARVFPRRTAATPTDQLAFVGDPPLLLWSTMGGRKFSEIWISVAFSWDIAEAERLAVLWAEYGPVKIGGPAWGSSGEDFAPGIFLKKGYVITSRGCPNRCWFCSVWKREGPVTRELPIAQGHNVLDDNLLACSDGHIRAVFKMLREQKLGRVEFSGGLEAARFKQWHADLLAAVHPTQFFFAYDTPDDYEPLVEAGKILQRTPLNAKCFVGKTLNKTVPHRCRAYVLIGAPGDTHDKAEKRLKDTLKAGFWPAAMLWRDPRAAVETEPGWKKFQRIWTRPAIMGAIHRGALP